MLKANENRSPHGGRTEASSFSPLAEAAMFISAAHCWVLLQHKGSYSVWVMLPEDRKRSPLLAEESPEDCSFHLHPVRTSRGPLGQQPDNSFHTGDPGTLPHPVHHLRLFPRDTKAAKEASSEATKEEQA